MPNQPKVPASPSLLSLEPTLRRELKAANRSPRTEHNYLTIFYNLCKWLTPDGKAAHCTATLADIDRETITSFFAYLHEKYSPNWVLSHHIALRVFFTMAIEYGAMEEPNPMKWIERPTPEVPPPPIPTDEQIKKLLATCANDKSFKGLRDHALIRVFLSSGARIQEVTDMDVADVNMTAETIEIRHGKGRRSRTVAFGDKTAKALQKYLYKRERSKHANLPNLWLSQRGAMAYKTIFWTIAERARQAGITGIHPHAFRHLFTHDFLVATDGNESDVKTLAGWTSSRMLERYGAAAKKERAINAAHRHQVGEKH